MTFYRQINVWTRVDEERLALYRCFQVLPGGGYCVQSKDFFMLPLRAEALSQSESDFVELLLEVAPEVRSGSCETLEEAIRRHDQDFISAASIDDQ